MKEIKQYKPLILVEVAFGVQIEHLYWEGSEEQFKKAMQYDYIYFGIYGRNVANSKIKDFKAVKDVKNITREIKISHLTEDQKTEVKELSSRMLKNIGREPTDTEYNSIIDFVVFGKKEERQKPFTKLERFKTFLQIKKMRIAKILNGKFYF